MKDDTNSTHITNAIAELDLDNALDFISARDLNEEFINWTRKAWKKRTGLPVREED